MNYRPKWYISVRRKIDQYKRRKQCRYRGCFVNRSKNSNILCVVLAGYKEYLYDAVFDRLTAYMKKGIDVCVVSSGLYSRKLDILCKQNDWSYLSTKRNDIGIAQNAAINLHPNAQYIFKLDEDIFVTKGYFDNMMAAYRHAMEGDYVPGVLAPMILVNGFSHLLILKKFGLEDKYESLFEKPKFIANGERHIQSNPDAAKFMWGDTGDLPHLDAMNEIVRNDTMSEVPCPIRFSIGAILFERKLWSDMGYFPATRWWRDRLGMDEKALCGFCCAASRPIMISENIIVGHLSFGEQNLEMKAFFLKHKDRFALHDE